MERPRICGMDLPREVVEDLKKKGYAIFEGSLGTTIKVPNRERGQGEYMLLDHQFPKNFHEFDISIFDSREKSIICLRPSNRKSCNYIAVTQRLFSIQGP